MKNALIASTGLALAATSFSPALAQSHSAHGQTHARVMTYEECVDNQRGRQVAGALIGGLLGAALGAEMHDDRQDRRFNRAYRNGNYRRAGRIARQENDGSVAAGAGLGALAGAAIAGSSGDECARYAHQGQYQGQHNGYSQGHYQNQGYSKSTVQYERDFYDQGHAYQQGPDYGDNPRHSSDELAGGYDYDQHNYEARTYRASASYTATGNCRNMQSSGRVTYMCQGTDGIWRPANAY